MDFELTLAIFFGRAIELLAFYLILANINGRSLKESFVELVVTKQKNLYGNVVVLVAYPLVITFVVQIMREHGWQDSGYLLDLLLRPFVAYFLLRLIFNVKKASLAYLFVMGIGFIAGGISLVFNLDENFLHGVLVFLSALAIVSFMSSRHLFENLYVRLVTKRQLLNVVVAVSLVAYILPFLIEAPTILFLLFPVLFLIVVIHLKKETTSIIEKIKNAGNDNLFQVLKDISTKHEQTAFNHQYTIENQNINEIAQPLSKRLDFHKRRGTFKDYEYIVTKRQIKINVLI